VGCGVLGRSKKRRCEVHCDGGPITRQSTDARGILEVDKGQCEGGGQKGEWGLGAWILHASQEERHRKCNKGTDG